MHLIFVTDSQVDKYINVSTILPLSHMEALSIADHMYVCLSCVVSNSRTESCRKFRITRNAAYVSIGAILGCKFKVHLIKLLFAV